MLVVGARWLSVFAARSVFQDASVNHEYECLTITLALHLQMQAATQPICKSGMAGHYVIERSVHPPSRNQSRPLESSNLKHSNYNSIATCPLNCSLSDTRCKLNLLRRCRCSPLSCTTTSGLVACARLPRKAADATPFEDANMPLQHTHSIRIAYY
jgi:hypothetical protein